MNTFHTFMREKRIHKKLVDLSYSSGKLDYEHIRWKILLRKPLLELKGYACEWNADLGPTEELNLRESRERGYVPIYDGTIKTHLDRAGVPFNINIYPQLARAEIGGETTVWGRSLDSAIRSIKELEKITGIRLKVQQASNPY